MRTHIERVKLKELLLLKKNARFMKNETFRNLVENIRRDGVLTSVPLLYPTQDGLEVLSGNHRVQAALAAGIEEADAMIIDEHISRGRRVAIQLSHNSLTGEDDPVVLKELWDEIDKVDEKFYAGLDDKTLQELESVELPTLAEVSLDYRTTTFMFLTEDLERLEKAFKEALEIAGSNEAYSASILEFDRILEAQAKTGGAYRVRNSATALMLVLDVFERHLEDLRDGFLDEYGEAKHSGWVSLSTVTGTEEIPAPAAAVINRAVQRMVDRGEVSSKAKWQAIEVMAAEYLAGAE